MIMPGCTKGSVCYIRMGTCNWPPTITRTRPA
nr:MAG TPA: hypothetical protein [Caudoviricetes sp.]